MFELLVVSGLRVLTLQIDVSEKPNRVHHKTGDMARVLVQKGERTREADEPAAG